MDDRRYSLLRIVIVAVGIAGLALGCSAVRAHLLGA